MKAKREIQICSSTFIEFFPMIEDGSASAYSSNILRFSRFSSLYILRVYSYRKKSVYSHFHKTGEKEFKNRDILKMSVTIDCELKLVCKINRFLHYFMHNVRVIRSCLCFITLLSHFKATGSV